MTGQHRGVIWHEQQWQLAFCFPLVANNWFSWLAQSLAHKLIATTTIVNALWIKMKLLGYSSTMLSTIYFIKTH